MLADQPSSEGWSIRLGGRWLRAGSSWRPDVANGLRRRNKKSHWHRKNKRMNLVRPGESATGSSNIAHIPFASCHVHSNRDCLRVL